MKKSLLVLSLILALVFAACNKKEESVNRDVKAQEEQDPKKEEIYNVDLGTAVFRGPQDAPVTVINFSDFQCPFSKRSVDLMEGLLKKYNGKVVVIKYGGNAMINEQLKQQVMEDIVLLWLIGVRVVLVHGGGPEINGLMDRLGKKPEFVDGLRVTDQETMDIVQMVLAGKINKTLVNLLEMKGGRAVGLSGMDGRLLQCTVKDERLGFVGEIQKVHIQPVTDLLNNGYIPVVSTVGCDKQGNAYNINGDTAAACIAGALNAERLIMMTDIAGVLLDRNDPSTLIPEITLAKDALVPTERLVQQ